jgi:hypothetical protein
MIRFSLRCANGHSFDSWFRSGEAFDTLVAAGQVACMDCGETKVEKSLMAPFVTEKAARPTPDMPGPLTSPQSERDKAIAALKAKVEATSDYVGLSFAAEARAMHLGEKPERAIYGEARPDEARKLIEDGIPVAPLPFTPTRKAN